MHVCIGKLKRGEQAHLLWQRLGENTLQQLQSLEPQDNSGVTWDVGVDEEQVTRSWRSNKDTSAGPSDQPELFQFSSVTQSCPTLCDPMDCNTPSLPVHHQLPEVTQTHVHWVSDAIQPSHPLSSPSPPTLNLSQHQGLFQGVCSLHQVVIVLEFQLQHQSFQWIFRTDFL